MAEDSKFFDVSSAISRRSFVGGAAAAGAGVAFAGMGAASAAPASHGTVLRSTRAGDPTTMVIAMDGSPSDLDPHSCYDYRSVLAILGTYEGLVALDTQDATKIVGKIAESWEANEDKSVWTFKIRQGVKFHNGDICDSAAILANYDREFTLGLGPIGVLGRFISDYKTQITAPDANTVVFTLDRPQPLLEFALASAYANGIVNAKVMKEHEADSDWGHIWAQTNAEGTGTGPYRVAEFTPDDKLVFEKNPDYWGGWDGNHFETIILRVVTESATRRQLLEKGEADIVDSLPIEDVEALKVNPDINLLTGYTTQIQYFPMTVYGALATPEARQAICMAMPYDDYVNGVIKGYGRQPKGSTAEACHGFSPTTDKFSTDLVKAKELLAQAGVAEGTELHLMIESGVEQAKTAAQMLQANLAEIGINLMIDLVDLPTFTATFYGDAPIEERPNLFWWGWWPDYNDAWNHLYPQVSSEAWGSKGANAGFYKNDRVDELLNVAKDAPDEESYLAALAEIQEIVSVQDPPAIYYVEPMWTTLHRKDVAGVYFSPVNIGTYDFYTMSRVTG